MGLVVAEVGDDAALFLVEQLVDRAAFADERGHVFTFGKQLEEPLALLVVQAFTVVRGRGPDEMISPVSLGPNSSNVSGSMTVDSVSKVGIPRHCFRRS